VIDERWGGQGVVEVVEEFALCRGPDGALCGWELPAAEVKYISQGLPKIRKLTQQFD
jgi:hypothetical protein